MTLVWLGSNGLQNYWQGLGDPNTPDGDAVKIPTPRAGDMYLNIETKECFTYDPDGDPDKWFILNG